MVSRIYDRFTAHSTPKLYTLHFVSNTVHSCISPAEKCLPWNLFPTQTSKVTKSIYLVDI